MDAPRSSGGNRRTVALAAAPLLGLVALVAFILAGDPLAGFRTGPPIEEATVERTTLRAGEIEIRLRNAGPDPVTVAQVFVNGAFWSFETADPTMGRLDAATLTIPYPWVEGSAVTVTILTSTGATIEHRVDPATATPPRDTTTALRYVLLGLLIGPLPVAVGLLAKPALGRLGPATTSVLVAATVGLLTFLLVDTLVEGIEQAEAVGALDGPGLLLLGAGTAVSAISLMRSDTASGVALLLAGGIGLHNLGEGLAVGVALGTGSVALGATLLAGFVLHNTTEGLAIATPLARDGTKGRPLRLALLVGVAGAPAVVGIILGGYTTTPAFAAFAFGAAAGAIAQVTWVIVGQLAAERRGSSVGPALGFLAGLLTMYATGLLAG